MSLPRTVSANAAVFIGLQLLNITLTPLLTRATGPAELAHWFLWFNVIAVLLTAGTWRYELGIVTVAEDEDALRLLLACIALAGISTLVVFGATLAWFFSDLRSSTTLLRIAAVSAGAGFAGAINQAIAAWHLRRGRILCHNVLTGGATTLVTVLQVFFVRTEAVDALFLGGLGGYALCAAIGLVGVVWRDAGIWRRPWGGAWTATLSLIVSLRQFPLYSLPFTVVVLLRERLVYIFLASAGSAESVAYFGLAHRLVGLGTTAVGSAVRPVFFNLASREGVTVADRLVIPLVLSVSCIIVPIWICGLFWGAPILQFVFGPGWGQAAPYLVILSIPYLIIATTGWLDRIYDVLRQQRQLLLIETAFSILTAVGLAGAHWLSASPLMFTVVLATVFTVYGWVWLHLTLRSLGGGADKFRRIGRTHILLYLVTAAIAMLANFLLSFPIGLVAAIVFSLFFSLYSTRASFRVLSLTHRD